MSEKIWPCGTEKGNPFHFDCKKKACKKEANKTGEGLGITCIRAGKLE